jgi:hypothetical protein
MINFNGLAVFFKSDGLELAEFQTGLDKAFEYLKYHKRCIRQGNNENNA